jgi:hypothetical protein
MTLEELETEIAAVKTGGDWNRVKGWPVLIQHVNRGLTSATEIEMATLPMNVFERVFWLIPVSR